MLSFYLKKLVNNLISLFIFITMIFFLVQVIIPHDFTTQFAMGMNREQRARMQEELGLNLPLHQQYFNWLRQIITGNFGDSFYGFDIVNAIKNILPMTLLVFLTGTIIAFMIGQWLGKVTAWKGPGFLTGTATFTAVAFYTAFPAWLGFLLVYFLVEKFQIIPRQSSQGLFNDLGNSFPPGFNLTIAQIMNRMIVGLVAIVTLILVLNFVVKRLSKRRIPVMIQLLMVIAGWVVSWFIFGVGWTAWGILKLASIAIITYVLLSMGETMLVMQTSIRDTLSEEYIRTARGKGLPEGTVRDRHAAPNAIIPVLSRMVVSLPYLLTGIVIIEYTVGWHGMGMELYNALYQQDIPMVMAILLLVGLVSMIARLVLEFLELYLNPRLRDEVAEAQVNRS